MKSKPSANASETYATVEFGEILDTLRMIHKDSVIAIDEGHFVHLGNVAQACIKHLLAMKERITELESKDVDTRH
jgi:hypothetical protein